MRLQERCIDKCRRVAWRPLHHAVSLLLMCSPCCKEQAQCQPARNFQTSKFLLFSTSSVNGFVWVVGISLGLDSLQCVRCCHGVYGEGQFDMLM